MKYKDYLACIVLLQRAAACTSDDLGGMGPADTPDVEIRFDISFASCHSGLDPCHSGLDPESSTTEWEILSQAQDDRSGRHDIPTTQTLNLATGSLSGQSGAGDIRIYPCPDADGSGTSLFRFRYRDSEQLVSPKLTADLTLAPGRAETFTVAFPCTAAVSATVRLADLIPEAERAKVTRLYVTGPMTANDFAFIKYHLPNITALDLSQATVVGNKIPDYALTNKKGLQEFSFPAGITEIGNYVFFSCQGLTGSLTIPGGITTIGRDAFCWCHQITSITCHIADPGNVTFGANNGTEVFDLMASVTAVYVPAAAVDAYKAHPAWSQFADKIQPIPNNK